MSVEEIIRAFYELGSAFIADGMQLLGLPQRIADPALRPLLPSKRVAGTVVTELFEYRPTEQPPVPYTHEKMFEQAKQVASPVLVTESRTGIRAPYGGGACRAFVRARIIGVIIDGAIRDIADIKAQGMQMFYRLISVDSWVVRKLPEGYIGSEAGGTICVGSVVVTPGDLVIADEDGIVFCCPEDAPAVIEAAREILTEEEEIFKKWDAGQGYLEGEGLAPQ